MLGRLGARCTLPKQANLFNEVPSVLLGKLKNECTFMSRSQVISFPSSNLGMHTLKLCLMSSGGTGFATPFLTFNISLPSSGLGVTT